MTDKTIEIEVVRDFWVVNEVKDEPAVRIRAGRILEVPLNEATLAGIESGSIKRVTPEKKAEIEKAKAESKKKA